MEAIKEKIEMIDELDNKFKILQINEGTIEGVNIPCILALPENIENESRVVLIFNNENGKTLKDSTNNIKGELPSAIEGLDIKLPIVIPILPSKEEFNNSLKEDGVDFRVGDPKQFAKECFAKEIPKENRFYRLDEQVKKIIEAITNNLELKKQIQHRSLKEQSISFSDKIYGFGHSGAGAAMMRFGILAPEILDTVVIGGNGDIIPTPFGENASKLEYPFGAKGYEELLGREFSEEDYKKINFQFYIGDNEASKPVYDTIRDENYEEGMTGNNFAPKELADAYKNIYGRTFWERMKNVLKQYENNGINIGLKIYENDCHSPIKPEDLEGILNQGQAFNTNCSEQIEKLIKQKEVKDPKIGYKCIDSGTTHIEEQQQILKSYTGEKIGSRIVTRNTDIKTGTEQVEISGEAEDNYGVYVIKESSESIVGKLKSKRKELSKNNKITGEKEEFIYKKDTAEEKYTSKVNGAIAQQIVKTKNGIVIEQYMEGRLAKTFTYDKSGRAVSGVNGIDELNDDFIETLFNSQIPYIEEENRELHKSKIELITKDTLLESAIEATKEETRIEQVNEQVRNIKGIEKAKEEKSAERTTEIE